MENYGLTFPLSPRKRVFGHLFGDAKGVRRGKGIEPIGVRQTDNPDPKHIDWNKMARMDPDDADPYVREQIRTESIGAVIIVDRMITMADPVGDNPLGLLEKHTAATAAGIQIVESARKKRGAVGYRDFSHGTLYHKVANGKTDFRKVIDKYLPHEHFRAMPGQLAAHLADLRTLRGAFVFVLSDFLDETLLNSDIWEHITQSGYDPVPVLIQDPVWEQTFPDEAAGLILPFRNPLTGREEERRYSRSGARQQRTQNESRIAYIRETFINAGLDWVEISTTDPVKINTAFKTWSAGRKVRRSS